MWTPVIPRIKERRETYIYNIRRGMHVRGLSVNGSLHGRSNFVSAPECRSRQRACSIYLCANSLRNTVGNTPHVVVVSHRLRDYGLQSDIYYPCALYHDRNCRGCCPYTMRRGKSISFVTRQAARRLWKDLAEFPDSYLRRTLRYHCR